MKLLLLCVALLASTALLPSASAWKVDKKNKKEYFAKDCKEFKELQKKRGHKPDKPGKGKRVSPNECSDVVKDKLGKGNPIFTVRFVKDGPHTGSRKLQDDFIRTLIKDGAHVYHRLRHGFSAALPEELVDKLIDDPTVTIEGDVYFKKAASVSAFTPTTLANQGQDVCYGLPWPLDRIDQRVLPLDNALRYGSETQPTTDGARPIRIYVLDTGVDGNHEQFCAYEPGKREYPGCTSRVLASCSKNFAEDHPGTACHPGSLPEYFDADGHGTHCAGTAAGRRTGVAKDAVICSVRVLDQHGSGWSSSILAGINFVQKQIEDDVAAHNGEPSFNAVVSMSLSGPYYQAENDELQELITPRADGYPGAIAVVAAGNEATDACQSSPASLGDAITVGASDIHDKMASFSNHGTCVNIFAPGVSIESAESRKDKRSQTSTSWSSGTSMATPAVAGAAALYWAHTPSASPNLVRDRVLSKATSGVLQGDLKGSPNKLLFVGPSSAPTSPSTAAPAHSACSHAHELKFPQGFNYVSHFGSTTRANTERGTIVHCVPSGKDVYFKFVAPASRDYSVFSCGSDFDTVVAVLGDSCSGDVVHSAACNDDYDGGCSPQSAVRFTAVAGKTYFIRLAGYDSASGNYALTLTTNAVFGGDCPAVPADVNAFPTCTGSCSAARAITTVKGSAFKDTLIGAKPTAFPAITQGSCFAAAEMSRTKGNVDMWFKLTPTKTGTLLGLSTCNTNTAWDSVLSLHSKCPDAQGDHSIACNNDFGTCGKQSKLAGLDLQAGATYFVRVSGFVPDGQTTSTENGAFELDIDFTGTLAGSGSDPTKSCHFEDQRDYRGHASHTQTGKLCQAWASQTPHAHTRTTANFPNGGLTENFCRNPDGSERAWCYTTDPQQRWDWCNVQCSGAAACQGVLCENGGQCADGVCNCKPGFSGVKCEKHDNPCENVVCENGGQCADGKCTCAAGWTGDKCQTNIDDCADVTCQNGGVCEDGVNTYTCACAAGWTGRHCETNRDDCATNPCLNGGTCHDGVNSYTCSCPSTFSGLRCEISESCAKADQTDYRGTVAVTKSGHKCQEWSAMAPWSHTRTPANYPNAGLVKNYCRNPDGAERAWCYTTDSTVRWEYCNVQCPPGDACSGVTCLNGGSCASGACKCPEGFTGARCEVNIDDCAGVTCKNGGTCVDKTNAFECKCASGFTGDQCQTATGPCTSVTCKNGGSCLEVAGGFRCQCVGGHSGTFCEVSENCAQATQSDYRGQVAVTASGHTCQRWDKQFPQAHSRSPGNYPNAGLDGGHNYCRNPDGGSRAWCYTTNPTLRWDYCDVKCPMSANDPCAGVTCHNGGTCNSGVCQCVPGWVGQHCQTNKDDCANNPCENGGTCVDEVNGFKCHCTQGFSGSTCAVRDQCFGVHCANGGTCDASNGQCLCTAGWTGATCEQNIDDCSPNQCRNGATCVDKVNGFECRCPPGFSGTKCETNIDECAPKPCLNGGTCVDGVNSYTCNCLSGFSGSRCEVAPANPCDGVHCQNGGVCHDGRCNCPKGVGGALCEIILCGNGVCDVGEDCNTCPQDCPRKRGKKGFCCGDGKKDKGETVAGCNGRV